MKAFATVLIGTLLALGLVTCAQAQPAAPAAPGTANPANPEAKDPSVPPTGPGTVDRPSVGVDPGRDGGAALPRQSPPGTPEIFGLSATTVALLAALLFIIIVLAVAARNRDASRPRIDVDRRL
jgi:hypothetical protein